MYRLLIVSLLCAACDNGLCLMGVDPATNPKLAALAKKDGGALTITPADASSPDGGADLQQVETAASRDPYEDKPTTPPPAPPPAAPAPAPRPAPVRGKTAPA